MSAQTSRQHLLAIDDDAALRALYEDLFADVGFQVTVAESPVTVMDVRAVKPDPGVAGVALPLE
jgi:DNA-binding NtrC family response regulator